MSRHHRSSQSAPKALVLPTAPRDATAGQAAQHYHRDAMLTGVYHQILHRGIDQIFPGPELRETMLSFVTDTIRRAEPADPMEEMLVCQMLLAHMRSLHMTYLMGATSDSQDAGVLAQHAERASNTYRRLMLALAEYRRPARRSFTAIRQANVAHQQVVANGGAAEQLPASAREAEHPADLAEQLTPPEQGG